MRILHILHQFMPEKIGGTELYTQTLARHQVQRGHHVAIFTPATHPETAVTVENGVQVHRVRVRERSPAGVFRSNFRQPEIETAFGSVYHVTQPDLVHVQHLMGLPINLVKQIDVPTVVTLHDYWYLCLNAQLLTNYDDSICDGPRNWVNCGQCALARARLPSVGLLGAGLAPLLGWRHTKLRQVLDNAAALIAPTRFTRDIYAQMGLSAEQIQVVAHGIKLPAVMPAPAPRSKGLRIAYVGGIARQKGLDALVTAVNQLPNDVELHIYGDLTAFPQYTRELEHLNEHPGIRFAGRLPHDELWNALAQADVLVVPSLWYETAALVIQEAFAAGVPVVASRLGALQERVQDGVDGRLFTPGDANELTNILTEFNEHPQSLDRLREGIRPVITIEEHINAIEDIYQKSALTL